MKFLEIIRSLDLPNNPLDDIVDQVISVFIKYKQNFLSIHLILLAVILEQLGGPDKVAEITGRRGMLVRASDGKGVTYQARNT